MVLASKAVHCGIVFLLLAMEISGPHPTPITSRVGLESEVPGVSFPNDTDKMQQILQDKGHYRGKVDGVFGLRTRASIRSYQKAENLPVTGQLDNQTAGKLGVRPEVREGMGYETNQDKPSAGVTWVRGPRRTNKAMLKPIRK